MTQYWPCVHFHFVWGQVGFLICSIEWYRINPVKCFTTLPTPWHKRLSNSTAKSYFGEICNLRTLKTQNVVSGTLYTFQMELLSGVWCHWFDLKDIREIKSGCSHLRPNFRSESCRPSLYIYSRWEKMSQACGPDLVNSGAHHTSNKHSWALSCLE